MSGTADLQHPANSRGLNIAGAHSQKYAISLRV